MLLNNYNLYKTNIKRHKKYFKYIKGEKNE